MKKHLGGIGYSYIRFSTPEQADGDSLRRQTDKANEWCERNGVKLDTKTTFKDLGRSGFTGEHLKNPELGGLAAFLALAEKGKIAKGAFLVCENADRVTRQGGWDAIGLFHKLVTAGIRIVLLSPSERIIDHSTDEMEMMMLLAELARGTGESKRKRELIGGNWQRWKKDAAETKEYRPGKKPFWLDRKGNGYALNTLAAGVIRSIYRMSLAGWGYIRIARHLRENGIRPLQQSKHSDGWLSPAYLIHTLKNPSVYGRCEELDCDDYFPPVMSKEEWFKVQAVLASRNTGGGGKSEWVHLLKGLVQHRVTGAVYYPHLAMNTKTKCYLTSDYKKGGKTPVTTFPVHGVEQAICDCVRELDWNNLFESDDSESGKILSLEGEIADLQGRITEAQEALKSGKRLASLLPVLDAWQTRQDAANEELKELTMKASSPKADLFADIKEVLNQLKKSDETELRLKAASLIARVIDKVEAEFKGDGKWRMAWLRVRFKDTDSFREIYVLYHKPLRLSLEETTEYLWWEHNKLVADAETADSEAVFAWIGQYAKEIDAERMAERREKKRLRCKEWHQQRKAL